jgi:hypothetical protein
MRDYRLFIANAFVPVFRNAMGIVSECRRSQVKVGLRLAYHDRDLVVSA